ncbi:MAG: alpha/beta hydrolase [Taibaiella sp.]|nr:alpha/beta hydrolase [Taibaiella sp.]
MKGSSGYIGLGQKELHYTRSGYGQRVLLVFHGYGHEGERMRIFENYLGEEFTSYFIDLPHHGKSLWNTDDILTVNDVNSLVKELMKTHNVPKVSLLGYSMGGRVCLSIIDQLPEYIDKVTLLAPDGLRIDPYYLFFTGNFLGKKIFRHVVAKPGFYKRVIKVMKDSNLIDESRYKFVQYYLNSEYHRLQLGSVWPAMAALTTTVAGVKEKIKKHNVNITIFTGKYDKVIPPSLAEKFVSGLNSVDLNIIEKGHRVFDSGNAAFIARTLL